jgi:hypothetical protein
MGRYINKAFFYFVLFRAPFDTYLPLGGPKIEIGR